MDISSLSWTTGGYQQNKRFYGFLAITCSVICLYSTHAHIIIIMHVIVGSQDVFEQSNNSYIYSCLSTEVGQTTRVLVVYTGNASLSTPNAH